MKVGAYNLTTGISHNDYLDPQKSLTITAGCGHSAAFPGDAPSIPGYRSHIPPRQHPGHTFSRLGRRTNQAQDTKPTSPADKATGKRIPPTHTEVWLSAFPLPFPSCLLQTYPSLPSLKRKMDERGRLRTLRNTKHFCNLLCITQEESTASVSFLSSLSFSR